MAPALEIRDSPSLYDSSNSFGDEFLVAQSEALRKNSLHSFTSTATQQYNPKATHQGKHPWGRKRDMVKAFLNRVLVCFIPDEEGPPPSSDSAPDPPGPESSCGSDGPSGDSMQAQADIGVATPVNKHVVRLDADLDETQKEDLEFRRKHFKDLLLKWHPDKNTGGMGEAESAAQANEVFKHLLARRKRYLAE